MGHVPPIIVLIGSLGRYTKSLDDTHRVTGDAGRRVGRDSTTSLTPVVVLGWEQVGRLGSLPVKGDLRGLRRNTEVEGDRKNKKLTTTQCFVGSHIRFLGLHLLIRLSHPALCE